MNHRNTKRKRTWHTQLTTQRTVATRTTAKRKAKTKKSRQPGAVAPEDCPRTPNEPAATKVTQVPVRTSAVDGVTSVLAEADENPRPSLVVQDGVQVVLVADPHVLMAAVGAVEYPGHLLLLGKKNIRVRQRAGESDQTNHSAMHCCVVDVSASFSPTHC